MKSTIHLCGIFWQVIFVNTGFFVNCCVQKIKKAKSNLPVLLFSCHFTLIYRKLYLIFHVNSLKLIISTPLLICSQFSIVPFNTLLALVDFPHYSPRPPPCDIFMIPLLICSQFSIFPFNTLLVTVDFPHYNPLASPLWYFYDPPSHLLSIFYIPL